MGFPALLATATGSVLNILGGAVRYAAIPMGPFVDVTGVFDEQYQRADVSDVSVSGTTPAVFLSLADIAPLDPDTDQIPTVVVNGKTYRVRESKKDGMGGVLLMLTESGD